LLMTDGGYNSAGHSSLFIAYAQAGGNLMIMGYWLSDFGSDMVEALGFAGPYGTGDYLMEEATGSGLSTGLLHTDDLAIPIWSGYANRICERIYPDAAASEDFLYNEVNVVALNPGYPAARPIGVINPMPQGNYAMLCGQSLPFLDQTHADAQTFGNRLLALWGVTDATP
ncbi:MAG: hypothetical protein ACYS21_12335, partial [Planctomycetota bacterium]